MISVDIISNELNVNPETVRRWIRNGELKAVYNSKKEGYVINIEEYVRFKANYKHGKYSTTTQCNDDVRKLIFNRKKEIERLQREIEILSQLLEA